MALDCTVGGAFAVLAICIAIVVVPVVIVLVMVSYIRKTLLSRRLNRWKTTPQDVVILHGFPPVKVMPNLSPFVMKVEAYLRLAKIDFTWDQKDYFGAKGKCPWISINGTHVDDSEFIIQYLGEKFKRNLSVNTSEHQKAVAIIVRTMLEEYFYSGIGMERMVYGDFEKFKTVADVPSIFFYYLRRKLRKKFQDQGLAQHSREEVTQLMTKNLKSVSVLLGGQKFFGGEDLCEEDCGIFAILAQCVWALPDSPYEELMKGDCSNLKEYCIRVKDKLWPDWDDCLAKPK